MCFPQIVIFMGEKEGHTITNYYFLQSSTSLIPKMWLKISYFPRQEETFPLYDHGRQLQIVHHRHDLSPSSFQRGGGFGAKRTPHLAISLIMMT